MHLDTITYAPVGNPAVSCRKSNRAAGQFQTSYGAQFTDQNILNNQQIQNSQSMPVSFIVIFTCSLFGNII